MMSREGVSRGASKYGSRKNERSSKDVKSALMPTWRRRAELRIKSDKLGAESDKLLAEADKLGGKGGKIQTEGYRLRVESNNLRDESEVLWENAVRQIAGNVSIRWAYVSNHQSRCELGTDPPVVFEP
jgi:hypothetical protein